MPLFWLDSPRFFMQIHVVDSFFRLLELRFVTIFSVDGQNSGTPFLLIIPEGARARVRTRSASGPEMAAAQRAAATDGPGPDPASGPGPDPGPGAFRND